MKFFQIEEPDGSPVDPEAPGAAIGILAVGAAKLTARLTERQLGGTQIPRQPVALECIAADLLADAIDLLAQ